MGKKQRLKIFNCSNFKIEIYVYCIYVYLLMDTTGKVVKIKRNKCNNGTVKLRDGTCGPITKEMIAEEKKKRLVIEPDNKEEKEVKTMIIRESKVTPFINDVLSGIPKNTNEFLRKKEQIEFVEEKKSSNHDYLYPTLNDPEFSMKIAKHQEFYDTQYDGEIYDIKKHADKMCDEPFELMPHQLFVKNFMSFQTPYNSLLLYHGLGSGKTCSAIGIAEEMRHYMKQVGIKQRIVIVAAPNVQSNFKLQLFDERNLKEIDGIWNIKSCVGNVFLREINPTSLKGVSRDRVVSQIKGIINSSYVFMGYVELANYIRKKTMVESVGFSEDELRKMEIQNMRKFFNNRLIIIDEIHNIRLSDDNKDDKTGKLLMKLAHNCNNMRLLLLSATPLYNSHTEIVWLTNLMNLNDKRGLITASEVFDTDGNFKKEKKDQDGTVLDEGGYELLSRKLTGYVSYIRGENPYIFPYRIYPDTFAIDKTFVTEKTGAMERITTLGQKLMGTEIKQIILPTVQLNTKKIETPMSYLPLYINKIGTYQERAYELLIKYMREDIKKGKKEMNFDEMDKFGFRQLQTPLEALNIVYPSSKLDQEIEKGEINVDKTSIDEYDPRATMVGKRGMRTVMNYTDDSGKKIPKKHKFSYKPEIQEKYGRIFSSDIIGNYSSKISSIIQSIKQSKGIVLIYSQYIDGGVVPMALALEELGFSRYGYSPDTTSLFETPPIEPMDSITMKPKSQTEGQFKPAQYVMITGDKSFSPNNAQDIKTITNEDNKNGEMVKVVLISKAGAEGLDFKCIRQVHILEPWYNLNRIEQIIGRGVRQKSHCLLPFEERNVEIYMHCTVLNNNTDEEAVDVYVYRLARTKAEKIGRVTRLLKETSVDCLLNIGQNNFTQDKLSKNINNQSITLNLSSGNKKVAYKIGDKPFTDICDYMEDCSYKCNKKYSELKIDKPAQELYSTDYVQSNNQHIMKRIRDLYRDKTTGQHFYNLTELIESINITKQYPIAQIYSALTTFINNKNEYIIDKYGRRGNLTNKGDVYAFQPIEINDENITIFERKVPIDFKRNAVSMEIPSKFVSTDARDNEQISYASIIKGINMNVSNATIEHSITQGDQNWYKHASLVMNHLQVVHKINYKQLVDYIIQHNIDMLMPDEKIKIISHLYSPSRDLAQLSEVEFVLKTYLDKNLLTHRNKSGFVIPNLKKKWDLYLQSSEDSNKWILAQPEDVRNFESSNTISDKLAKNTDQYSTIIGFIDMFRNNKEMVFRIKDISQMQNNTGTRINGQTPGKGDVIKRLNMIVDDGSKNEDPMYGLQKSKEIMQQGLCVIVELLLRHYTATNHKNKVWYLDPGEAMYMKIALFRQ
jgi:hypothetical protein